MFYTKPNRIFVRKFKQFLLVCYKNREIKNKFSDIDASKQKKIINCMFKLEWFYRK